MACDFNAAFQRKVLEFLCESREKNALKNERSVVKILVRRIDRLMDINKLY